MFKLALVSLSLFASHSFAQTSPLRTLHIKMVAENAALQNFDRIFKHEVDENFPGPAAVKKFGARLYVLKTNPKIMNTISPVGQKIVYYHEVGHYYLGHLEVPYQDNKEYQRTIELEADLFAAIVFKKREVIDQEVLKFIDFMRNMNSWPTGKERAAIYEEIFFQK